MRAAFRRSATVALFASTALAGPVLAQEQAPPAADNSGYGEIIVTAQKRSESIQNVPISITALGEQKLRDLHVSGFQDYIQQLPAVTFQALGGNPGTNVVYMRGVASGGDGNHSGPLPSVGVYLDEQPVTTIGGNLDIHIYDIARVESLAGPQGTLYGASSEAGTIRIITNKPELGKLASSIDGSINSVRSGGIGGKLEGMANFPLGEHAALRVVGWYQRDAGFIDNVQGCRAFLPETNPQACTATNGGITVNNSQLVKKNYNTVDTYGGRAALKVELDDNWTATAQVISQMTKSKGAFGYDPLVGDLKVQHFFPEYRSDKFIQAALTIEGKVGNWDLTYAGAYMDRKDSQSSDYTDYAEAYDQLYSSVGGIAGYYYFAFRDANGNSIDPRQKVVGTDHFRKMSHELRIASPSSEPVRFVGGMFLQRQSNEIHQDYQVAGLSPQFSVNGFPGTLWLTQQHRVDKDYAMFGEASWDVVPKVTLTAGVRGFIYDNSLIGFFGFGRDPNFVQGVSSAPPPPNAAGSTRTGVAGCFTTTGQRLRDAQLAGTPYPTLLPASVAGSPCTNLGVYATGAGITPVKASGEGVTYRFNGTFKPTRDLMFYATWSRGFRPGGINRRSNVPPYAADYLSNYEVGWKTTLLDGLLRFNGALYQQQWKHFQFAFLGANSFTEIHNGPNARIRGVELDGTIHSGPFNLNVSGAYTDAKIQQNLCTVDDPTFTCASSAIAAPKGTRLPITPRLKLAGTARYTQPVGAASVFGQLNVLYQSSASSDIRVANAAQLGRLDPYATVNLSFGANWDKFRIEAFVSNLFDKRGQLSRFEECGGCAQRTYIVPTTPRMIGISAGADF